jgi:hypothetical protein
MCVFMLAGALACDVEASGAESESESESESEAESESESETGGFGEIACDEEPVLTFDTFGRGFLATYCNGCHGGEVADRKGAPPAVMFDEREMVSTFAERILVRVTPPDGVPPMPPAGGVTEDDLERARIWLTCYP